MIPPLSPVIAQLEAKPGKDWTSVEREACRSWLISEKWNDLQREVSLVVRTSPADHRAGVMAAFLNGKLEPVLDGYEPGHNGIWPYVVVCLRRHCWKEAQRLNLEHKLTREVTPHEDEPTLLDACAPPPGTPPYWLLDKDLHDLAQREFARLRPSYRDPLLRRIYGRSYKEIADELGLTVTVVKIRIFRGRQELRKALRVAWPGAPF